MPLANVSELNGEADSPSFSHRFIRLRFAMLRERHG
jgi:hypothetical protein